MSVQHRFFEVLKPTPWIENDCRVKQCDEGLIEDKGILFKCPSCNRSPIKNLITSRKPITYYSHAEMDMRKKEREKVVYDSDYRLERNKEMLMQINRLLANANGNGAKKVSCPVRKPVDEEEIPF